MGLPAITANLHSSAVGKLQDRELQQEKKLLHFLQAFLSLVFLLPLCALFVLLWLQGMTFWVLLVDASESFLENQ